MLKRAVARELSGDEALAKEDINAALSEARGDSYIATNAAAYLSAKGEHERALEILEPLRNEEHPANYFLVLAKALVRRAEAGDLDKAILALEADTELVSSDDIVFRQEYIELLTELYVDASRPQDGVEFIRSLPPESLPTEDLTSIQGLLHYNAEQREEASDCANRVLAQVTDSTSFSSIVRTAKLFHLLGEYSEALSLWERVVPRDRVVPETSAALSTAIKGVDDSFILRLGADLRASGCYDEGVFDLELAKLEQYQSFHDSYWCT